MKVNDAEIINLKSFQDVSIFYTPTKEKSLTTKKSSLEKYKLNDKLNLFLKRVMDIFGSIIGILILIPLTIFVATVNFFMVDPGPIFYSQKRIGKDGKYFKIYKFRTMHKDADKKLEKYLEENPDMKEEWEKNQKLQDDPRITRFGKFLRKTSLDEFPQFINVLKGEMSLVGPRAVVDGEIDKFGELKDKVLSVKPGITGYWAANGRSNTGYTERVIMEATYVDNFSIFMDIKLLLKTIITVIKKEGAV